MTFLIFVQKYKMYTFCNKNILFFQKYEYEYYNYLNKK